MTSPVGWDADPAVETVGFDALAGPVTADVCVVGLGGSGLAAIGAALGRGLDVVGIDAGRVAAGAAGRNGGFLLGGPVEPVHIAAERFGVAVALEQYRQTLDEIDRLQALLGADVIRRTGSIRLVGLPGDDARFGGFPGAVDRAAEAADCAAQEAFMRAHGLAVERYSGPLGEGLFFPQDAVMNPVRRARGLAARYAGEARLYEHTPAVTIGPRRVETPAGSVSAGLVLVALDGRLDVLLPQLSGRVRTARLQMAATAPLPERLLTGAVYARWGYEYAQQDATGRIFVGGGRDRFLAEEWTDDASPSAGVQRWIDAIIDRFTGGGAEVTHRWAASVGFTDDLRPLVTAVDEAVVACGGYSGTGNLVGPIAARAALALGLDGTAVPSYFAS